MESTSGEYVIIKHIEEFNMPTKHTPTTDAIENRWQGKSWDWFGLSYASWLTIPRIVLQSMPCEWQEKFFLLLDEIEETLEEIPEEAKMQTTVIVRKKGKFAKNNMPGYRHNLLKLKK